MTRTALLRHDLPDGSHHYDWLVELPIWGEHRLLCWRVATPAPITQDAPTFRADILPLHRASYLTHEGPIPGNRGTVRRLAEGPCRVLMRTSARVTIAAAFAGSWSRFQGDRRSDAPTFHFVRHPSNAPETPTLAPRGTSV